MDIKRHVDGWEIKPHTSTEEKALAFLLGALEATYGAAQEAFGEEPVNQQDLIEIPAGTLIKIDGLPFTLAELTPAHGSKENLKLIRQSKLPAAGPMDIISADYLDHIRRVAHEQKKRYEWENPGSQVPPTNGVWLLQLVEEIERLQGQSLQ